jgi:propanediol dehydratase small subunit
MSLRNILVGLACGVCLLAVSILVWWRWSIDPLLFLFVAITALGIGIGIREERCRVAFRQRFWNRSCTGLQWRRFFPKSNAAQIREFLNIFIKAFLFDRKRGVYFSPDDKIMEIYRGLNPDRSRVDAMELDILESRMRKQYGIDAASFWHEDITLGELFLHTQNS